MAQKPQFSKDICVMEKKVLFSRISKPEMFGLGMAQKDNFLAYSTKFIFLITRLASANVVMVAIYMCGKSAITGEWIYGITWKHVLLFMFCLLIHLFDFLILYLHFYICNFWFVLASSKSFKFIFLFKKKTIYFFFIFFFF